MKAVSTQRILVISLIMLFLTAACVVPSSLSGIVKQAPAVAKSPEYFYTVKPGDSLWKIANDQLGSAGAISAIKDLNKDTLKGRDTVQVGMKLRLPAKPIASAS